MTEDRGQRKDEFGRRIAEVGKSTQKAKCIAHSVTKRDQKTENSEFGSGNAEVETFRFRILECGFRIERRGDFGYRELDCGLNKHRAESIEQGDQL